MVPQFKTSSAQSLATRARAIPELEATAHIYLQPASAEKLPHLKAEGMYCTKGQLISKCLLGVSNSPKNLKTQIFALAYWGRNFCSFLGELKNQNVISKLTDLSYFQGRNQDLNLYKQKYESLTGHRNRC